MVSTGDALFFDADDGSFRMPVPGRLKATCAARTDMAALVLGIRPIDVKFSKDARAGYDVPGTVYVFEPLGSTGILTVSVGETRVQIATGYGIPVVIGDRVWLDV